MAAIAEIIPPPQAIAHLLKIFGVPDRSERVLPPPQSSSFQAVASAQVLGHVMVADDCSQDKLRIEFTINVKRSNDLQDVIVQRSLGEFEQLHKALVQWRKAAPGRASIPGLPRLKPPSNKRAEWAATKVGELQRWLSLVVRDQDEFACDELSTFLGVALVSFLGVTPTKTPSKTDARAPAPAAEMPVSPVLPASPPVSSTPPMPPLPAAGVGASGAAAAFTAAMAKGAQPLVLAKGGGEGAGSAARGSRENSLLVDVHFDASMHQSSLPQGLAAQTAAAKAKGAEKGGGEGMRTYVQALEQELHNARQARADEEERRQQLELQLAVQEEEQLKRRQQLELELRQQSERLAAALERERAAQEMQQQQGQRGPAQPPEDQLAAGVGKAQRGASGAQSMGAADENGGGCGTAPTDAAEVAARADARGLCGQEGYPVGAAECS